MAFAPGHGIPPGQVALAWDADRPLGNIAALLSAARGLAAWLLVSGVHLMSTALLICVKAINGGLFVALFAVLGELLQPKRSAGIFGASPAVALGNLLVIALAEGEATARVSATGMIAGAVALAVACTAAIPAVRRWGTVWGSAVLWAVWLTVGGAVALPVAGAASARSPSSLPVGGQAGRQADTSRSTGVAPGRLFAVGVGALREIPLPALVVRFAFGATISVVAGLIGVLAGKAAGGVMLAAPTVLPATLTIIERSLPRSRTYSRTQWGQTSGGAAAGTVIITPPARLRSAC